MVLRFFGRKTDPEMVNRLITAHGGYTSTGLYYWQTLANIYEYNQKYVDAQSRMLTQAEMDEITETIEKKRIPVIIQVDMNPNTLKSDMHFVVAYGWDGTHLQIADPWTGETYALRTKYFGKYVTSLRRGIYRYVIFAPKDYDGGASTQEPEKPQETQPVKPQEAFGVDVARYQGNIDFGKLKNAADFVIMKATENVGYTDPYFERNKKEAKKHGMVKGYYHFARGTDAKKEADYFLQVVGDLDKHDLLVLDWEIDHADADGWCRKWLDRVYEKTGVKPLLYTGMARANAISWDKVRAGDHGLWVARYPYEDDGKTRLSINLNHFSTYVMHQYSSKGRVDGISGNVDMNVCPYGLDVLKKYGAKGSVSVEQPEPTPEPAPTDCKEAEAQAKKYKEKYEEKKSQLKSQEQLTEAVAKERDEARAALEAEKKTRIAAQNETKTLKAKVSSMKKDMDVIDDLASKW